MKESERKKLVKSLSDQTLQHEMLSCECQLEGIFRNLLQSATQRQLSHPVYAPQHLHVWNAGGEIFGYLMELFEENALRKSQARQENPSLN